MQEYYMAVRKKQIARNQRTLSVAGTNTENMRQDFFHETTKVKCELRLPEYYVAGCNEQIAGSQQTRLLLEQILEQSCSRAICGVLCRTFKNEIIHLRLDFFTKQQK